MTTFSRARIKKIEVFRLDIPLSEPFVISLETITHARNVLVRITAENGLQGLGECSPYLRIAGETQDGAFAVAPVLAKVLLRKDPLAIRSAVKAMDMAIFANRCIKSAFDLALHDLAARLLEIPLYALLGGENSRELTTDMTVSMLSPGEMAAAAKRFAAAGFPAIKLKLGGGYPLDIDRVAAVRAAVGPEIPLRVDANQAWDGPTALQVLRGIAPFGIQYCEQPLPAAAVAAMAYLRAHSPVPLMADESLFDHTDAVRLLQEGACDMFNIKLSKSGGIHYATRIVHLAEAAGVPCQVGCFSETRIGMSALAHFALAFDQVRYFDLDAPLMLAEDPVTGGLEYQPNGRVCVPDDSPGIGATLDESFLRELAGQNPNGRISFELP
ncbi:MAG: mandelate racemase/muconate lactonizing enzyme family protein [Saprospiraceae bacterium]